MFWLPQDWMPYYAEWLLSFPQAPLGSVSIQAWVLACGVVIVLVSDAIVAIIRLVIDLHSKSAQKTETMKFAGGKSAAGDATGQADGSKKGQ